MSSPELRWLCKGERDPLTGIHSHAVIRLAGKWWETMGRPMIAEGLHGGEPPNAGGIMSALAWEQLSAEERYRVTVTYYEHHLLKPWLDELEEAGVMVGTQVVH